VWKLCMQTLIVVCGWPASGKTTIARILEEKLGIHRIDIDPMRKVSFGMPYPHPDSEPDLMKKDDQEMGGSYKMLMNAADINLGWGRSVIITATFSRKQGQDEVLALMARYPNVNLRVVWCVP